MKKEKKEGREEEKEEAMWIFFSAGVALPGTWHKEPLGHQINPYQTGQVHTLGIRVC